MNQEDSGALIGRQVPGAEVEPGGEPLLTPVGRVLVPGAGDEPPFETEDQVLAGGKFACLPIEPVLPVVPAAADGLGEADQEFLGSGDGAGVER